jgi:hypothetical protein
MAVQLLVSWLLSFQVSVLILPQFGATMALELPDQAKEKEIRAKESL